MFEKCILIELKQKKKAKQYRVTSIINIRVEWKWKKSKLDNRIYIYIPHRIEMERMRESKT